MRLSTSRRRSQAASNLYRHQNHHQPNLPTTIHSIESGSALKIQSKRLSRGNNNNSNNNNNTDHYSNMDALSCDCSISTLGDELSHDGGLLPESPIPTYHRWQQTSGNDSKDLDLPPIGPRRSTRCLDDSGSFQVANEDTTGTNTSRQRSIFSCTAETEFSEATDIIEDFGYSSNQSTAPKVMGGIIKRLEQRRASDFSPKPVCRTPSNGMDSSFFPLPLRLPSSEGRESSMGSLPLPDKIFSLNGSGLRSVDTPPSLVRRKESNHLRASDVCTDDDEDGENDCDNYDDDDDDDDEGSLITPRIPSDRPPELARRFTSPFLTSEVNHRVSLKASDIQALGIEAELLENLPVTKALISQSD